jgi:hypothetical protein
MQKDIEAEAINVKRKGEAVAFETKMEQPCDVKRSSGLFVNQH